VETAHGFGVTAVDQLFSGGESAVVHGRLAVRLLAQKLVPQPLLAGGQPCGGCPRTEGFRRPAVSCASIMAYSACQLEQVSGRGDGAARAHHHLES
jgi:hypothetical protein